jgi:DNA-binding transcriptional LysR family regulator
MEAIEPDRSIFFQRMFMMVYIHTVNLAAIDLNLLVALDALLAESNVTRAAKRVGLSQPAMSNALKRLRDLVGDPLFVRTPRGMLPTPRARELAGPVRDALAGLERALTPARFDPRTESRTFTIAAADSLELILGGPLLEALRAEAPAIRVAIVPPPRGADPTELFESGHADVAIRAIMNVAPAVKAPLRTEELFVQRLVVVARGTPTAAARRKMSISQFTTAHHVLVAPYGSPGSIIDDALARQRRTRTVAMRVSTFAAAPTIVATTDCIAVIPESIATRFAALLPLQIFELPFEPPAVPIGLIWHQRMDSDDAHLWFRALVKRSAVKAFQPSPRQRRLSA